LATEAFKDIHAGLRLVADVALKLISAYHLVASAGALDNTPHIIGNAPALCHHIARLCFSLGMPEFDLTPRFVGEPAKLAESKAALLSAIDDARKADKAYRELYAKPGPVPASEKRKVDAATARVTEATGSREAQLRKWREQVLPAVIAETRTMSGDLAQAKAVLSLVEDIVAALRARLPLSFDYLSAARWHAEACRQLLEAR
jgi:hypothetical protein